MGNGRYFIVVSFFSHLTVPLISRLSEWNVGVVFCDERLLIAALIP